jgi:hypothetical protein
VLLLLILLNVDFLTTEDTEHHREIQTWFNIKTLSIIPRFLNCPFVNCQPEPCLLPTISTLHFVNCQLSIAYRQLFQIRVHPIIYFIIQQLPQAALGDNEARLQGHAFFQKTFVAAF